MGRLTTGEYNAALAANEAAKKAAEPAIAQPKALTMEELKVWKPEVPAQPDMWAQQLPTSQYDSMTQPMLPTPAQQEVLGVKVVYGEPVEVHPPSYPESKLPQVTAAPQVTSAPAVTRYEDWWKEVQNRGGGNLTMGEFKEFVKKNPDLASEANVVLAEASAQKTEPSVSLDAFQSKFLTDRGFAGSGIFSLGQPKEINDIKQLAAAEYARLYGGNQAALSLGESVLASIFSPARALYPEVTLQDITPQEWAFGAAQLALLAAPGIGGVLSKVASPVVGKLTSAGLQAAAGTMFVSGTVESWDKMTNTEKAISAALDIMIIAGVGSTLKTLKTVNVPTSKPITYIEKIETPAPVDVSVASKLAKSSGESYKAMQSSIKKLSNTDMENSSYPKASSDAQKAIQKSLVNDRKFLDKLSVVKDITNSELASIEKISGITKLGDTLNNVNKAVIKVDKAWNTVESNMKIKNPTTPQMESRIKALDNLNTAKVSLDSALTKWADISVKPRYRIGGKPSDTEVIMAIDQKLLYARKALAISERELARPGTSESMKHVIKADIRDITGDINDSESTLKEYTHLMNNGQDLPATSSKYYTFKWEKGKPKTDTGSTQPEGSREPTASKSKITKMKAIDLATGKEIIIEKVGKIASAKMVMERPAVQEKLAFDLVLEPKYDIKVDVSKPELKTAFPKIVENRADIFRETKRFVIGTETIQRPYSAHPATIMPISVGTSAGNKTIPAVSPVIVATKAYLTQSEIKLGNELKTVVNSATKAYNQAISKSMLENMTAMQTDVLIADQVNTAISIKTNAITDAAIKEKIKTEYVPQIKSAIQNQTKPQTKTQTQVKTASKTATEQVTQAKVTKGTSEQIRPVKEPPAGKIPIPDIIFTDSSGKTVRLHTKHNGVVAWKHGFVYILKWKPYDKAHTHYSRQPIPGVIYASGVGSAAKSIVAMYGEIPKNLYFDMGIVSGRIESMPAGQPKLTFSRRSSAARKNRQNVRREVRSSISGTGITSLL